MSSEILLIHSLLPPLISPNPPPIITGEGAEEERTEREVGR
jgi:hypothetical protein